MSFLGAERQRTPSVLASASDARTRRRFEFAGLLLLVPLIWGFGFFATRLSLRGSGPLWANALRFILATAAMAPIVAWRGLRLSRAQIASGVLLGLLLFVAYACQTTGLVTSTVTRTGFIAALYAVATPILAPFFGYWPRRMVLFASALAVVGLWLVTSTSQGPASMALSPGDLLVLASAIITAFHILVANRVTRGADSFSLNFVQLTTVALCSLPAAFAFEGTLHFASSPAALFGLVYLALFSSGVAFTLQLVAQKEVAPTVAAIIFLLEAPLAAVAGALFEHDHLSAWQWLGAATLTLASGLAIRSTPVIDAEETARNLTPSPRSATTSLP